MSSRRVKEKARQFLEWFADRVDKEIAKRYGESLPVYPVVEFPRSGGSWIGDLLADALELPFPTHNVFPLGCAGVAHGHWDPTPDLPNVVYVVRDGRDAAVSAYHRAKTMLLEGRPHNRRYVAKRYPNLRSERLSRTTQEEEFREFLDDWFRRPSGAHLPWHEHVQGWLESEPSTVLKYESFRTEPEASLHRAVKELTGDTIEDEIVSAIVYKYSFKRQTGREPGEEDPSSAKRKGIVGDWKNWFDEETGRLFEERAGEALAELDYTSERDWYEGL